MPKKNRKRPGRHPLNLDTEDRAERSRLCARKCRVRKNVRYQYLEALVRNKEESIFKLKNEIKTFRQICKDLEQGNVPDNLYTILQTEVKKDDLLNVSTEESLIIHPEDQKITKDAQTTVSDDDFPRNPAKSTLSKATNCNSPDFVSCSDESVDSGPKPPNLHAKQDTTFSNCEKAFFGLLITELQQMLDSKHKDNKDKVKRNKDSNINNSENTNSECKSEETDTINSKPEATDTPILDWIVQNGSMFEIDNSDTEQSDKEEIFDGTESADDSNGFNQMGVKDYVHFLTTLSKVNSSQALDKSFEEEFRNTLNRSPTKDLEKHLVDSNRHFGDEAKINGEHIPPSNNTTTHQIVECKSSQEDMQEFTYEVTQHSKRRLQQSVSVQEQRNKTEERPKIQRFMSADIVSDGEISKQDQFPFLAFLLNNKDA